MKMLTLKKGRLRICTDNDGKVDTRINMISKDRISRSTTTKMGRDYHVAKIRVLKYI